jgi:hypothetical protein
MTKDEWKDLVKGICNQKILPKLRQIHRKYHPFEFHERFQFGDRGIYKSSRTIRFIEDNFEDDDDLSRVFNKEYLGNTLDNLRWGVESSNRLVLKTGISDVIEEFFEEIVDGMEISDIPDVDFDALREAGSQDPKSEILISMIRTKKLKKTIRYNSNESTMRYSLQESEKVVVRRKEVLEKWDVWDGVSLIV